MGLTLDLITGSDLMLDRDALTVVRKFWVKGTLPYAYGGDCFDYVASWVMGQVQLNYPQYTTPQGLLFWNSIQLHESYYAQMYEVSVTYSPYNKQTGTYLIRVEHSAGMAKATAGKPMARYSASGEEDDPGDGVFWDGEEVVGSDVPYNQTRIVVAYRHPQGFLNHTYLRAVGALVGHPNNDTFLGYAPGEIAYAGGNATESECEASAEYSFEVSRNETNLEVGGLTGIAKKGFDVLSPVYKWDTATIDGTPYPVRVVKYIDIIRPRGREWKDYANVFGWGGT